MPVGQVRDHPGIVPYSFRGTPASGVKEMTDFAQRGPVGMAVAALSGRPAASRGARLRGQSCCAAAAVVVGLSLSKPASSAPPTMLHIVGRSPASDYTRGYLYLLTDRSAIEEHHATAANLVSISVPVAWLPFDVRQLDPLLGTPFRNSPLAWRMMWSAAAAPLAGDTGEWVSSSAAAIDRYLSGLANLVLQLTLDERFELGATDAGLKARSDALIAASSDDPNLSPAVIAQRLGVSVRTLHRAYSGATGVADRLRRERLDRAAQRLSDPDLRRLSVAEVAARSGFGSLPTFNRAFAVAFDIAPHQYRLAREREGRAVS